MVRPRRGRAIDQRSIGAGLTGFAGADPREWVSYATVDSKTSPVDEQAVNFDTEDGQIYVNCTLKPAGIPIVCRLGQLFAGSGEASYFPLQDNDEVIVVIPGGDPKEGGVIVGRLNNTLDPFPFDSVAGADPTTNGFGVWRTRASMKMESGGSFMLRSAAHGTFLLLDANNGGITIRDGAGGGFQQNADMWGYQSGPGDVFLQMDLNAPRWNVQVGDASLVLAGSAASPSVNALVTSGTFNLATSTNAAAEHVITTEAMINVLINVLTTIGLNIAATVPGPLTGALLGPLLSSLTPSVLVAIAAGITEAVGLPLNPVLGTAITAAFNLQPQKFSPTPAQAGSGQPSPGIGCQGFFTG